MSNISGGKRGRNIVVRMQNIYVGLPAFQVQVQTPDTFRFHLPSDLLASGRFKVKHSHNFSLDSILAVIYTTHCAKQLQRFSGLDEVNNPLLHQLWKQIRNPILHSSLSVHWSGMRAQDPYLDRTAPPFPEFDQVAVKVRPPHTWASSFDSLLNGGRGGVFEEGREVD